MDSVNALETSVNARDVGEQVLKYFWDLASLDENARSTAAEGLVSELAASQAGFSLSNKTQTKQPTQSPSLVYGLKRLVRGLGSGRQGARQGYALALGKLLSDVSALPMSQVLEVMSSELDVSGQAKGTEAHDQMLGKVFGYAAIIRCKRPIDQETGVKCAEGLIHIANKKSFLRELAANVLLDLTDKAEPEIMAHILSKDSCGLKAWLTAVPSDSHPEALLLALHLWPSLPKPLLHDVKLLPADAKPPPKGYFSNPDSPRDLAAPAAAAFFAEKHLQRLMPVLRASSSSHPRLHSVWLTLFALLLPGFTAVKDTDAIKEAAEQQPPSSARAKGVAGPGQLETLWRVVAHDLLTSSHERKSLAFQLFTILLPNLQADQVPVVFSRAFLRCFSNNLTSSKNYLHSSAQRIAQRIIVFAGKARTIPGMQIALSVALQGVGGMGFDKLTKTNTVTKLLQTLDASTLDIYIQQLQEQFSKGLKNDTVPEDQQDIDKVRQRVVEQMCSTAAIRSVPASSKLLILKFLAMHAYFAVDKSAVGKVKPKELKVAVQAQPPPSAAIRLMCSARLISLIDSATKAAVAQASTDSNHKSKSKKRKAAELAEPAEVAEAPAAAAALVQARLESPFLAEVIAFVSKVQRAAGVTLAMELSEDVDEALSKLRESEALAATKLGAGATGAQGQQLRSMLALMRWLQLYMLADPAAAQPDVAVDLEGVFNGAFTKAKPAADEPYWMDVLVDILLSLLGRAGDALPFGPLKEACEALFRAFAEQVTPQGFGDLVRVVRPAPEGQDEDEDDDDDMFEEEGEDVDDIAAGVNGNAAAVAAAEAASDDSDEDDDNSEDGEEDANEEEAVAAALDASDGSGSSDEEEFDDDQMFQMDDKIAAALRVMAKGGANAKESREAISSFKFRVIGLLDIYVKKVPNSPVLPTALPALLAALTAACQQGGDAALANRLKALLTALTKAKAEAINISPTTGTVAIPEGEAMAALLHRTLYLASRHKDKKVTAAAAVAFSYLLRSSTTAEGLPSAETQTALKAALDDFFGKKKSKLHRKLFQDMLGRAPMLKGILLPALVQHTKTARSGYVKADGIALLLAFLRSCANKGQQSVTDVADAFRSHVPLIAELAVASISGDVGQSARQIEALKDIYACIEQLPKVYPKDSLQGLMGKHNLQLILQSVAQSHDVAKSKVDVQLKRLEHLLTEKDNSIAFAQHVKPISKKAAKKAKKGAVAASGTADGATDKNKKTVKKAKGMKGKSAKGSALEPKIKKNKDKYNKIKLAGSKVAK